MSQGTQVGIKGVNLAQVDGWDGVSSKLPPGEYVFNIMDVKIEPNRKGNDQLICDMEVAAGADSEQYNGVSFKNWISLIEGSAKRLRHFLDACDVAILPSGNFTLEDLIGKQFIAEVYEDEYKAPNLTTGEMDVKHFSKIRRERLVSEGFSATGEIPDVAPAAPAQAPAATPPARAAQPTARTTVPSSIPSHNGRGRCGHVLFSA